MNHLTAAWARMASSIRVLPMQYVSTGGLIFPGLSGVAAYAGPTKVGELVWNDATGEITQVEVQAEYRRQGIATQMLTLARSIDARVHHSTTLSQDGAAWSQKVAKAVVAYTPWTPPAHVEVVTGGDSNYGQYDAWVAFFDKPSGEKIGYIDYSIYEGEISIKMVEVEPKYRRQGYATLLLQAAKHDTPGAKVNPGYLTDDGAQWWPTVR